MQMDGDLGENAMTREPDPERVDEDSPEWTEEMIRQARSAAETVPELVESHRRRLGRSRHVAKPRAASEPGGVSKDSGATRKPKR